MIAFVLQRSGTIGVCVFIASSMAVVVFAIGFFGPRTRDRSLEAIAGA
jgi:putative MFS transporter